MTLFVQKMIWQGTNQTFNSREWDGRGISRGNSNFLLYIYICIYSKKACTDSEINKSIHNEQLFMSIKIFFTLFNCSF